MSANSAAPTYTSAYPPTGIRRVLFMISSMRGGGSEHQVLLLLQHLDRTKFEPHLFLTDPVGPLLSSIPEDVKIHSFQEDTEKSGLYFPGKVLREQISQLRDLLIKQTIDVIYDRTFHMSLIAGPAGKISSVPRIATIVSPPEFALPLLEKRFLWLKKRRISRAYRDAYQVIAVSRQAANSAKAFYRLPNTKIDTIANPVDRQRLQLAVSAEQVTRDDRWTFACVGRMTPEKGHHDLLDTLALLEKSWPEKEPAIHLWLIGDGPLRPELEQKAQKLERHQVSFMGLQKNPWKFIEAADAIIVPSHFEGMPNVVLEAMSLRTAVIATRIGGTNELEKERPTVWWANPRDPRSIGNSMIEFVTHRDEISNRIDAAEQLVVQNHDISLQTRKIEKLLTNACDSVLD